MDRQEHILPSFARLTLADQNNFVPEYDPYWCSEFQEATFRSQNYDFASSYLHTSPLHYPQVSPFSNGFDSFSLNDARNVSLLYRRPRLGFSLESCRGKLVEVAKNQYGCKLLQKVLANGAPEEIETVFFEIIDHVDELMVDQFGNYVVQKIVEVCNEQQRSQIVMSITKTPFQLVKICLDMHGTRAVQMLLRYIHSPKDISMVMAALRPGFLVLIKDVNGHHVIVHCLKNFSVEENKYLLIEAAKYCSDIARDKSGCCVLQLCVENSQGQTKDRLVDQIIVNALTLADDPYGNYVVQHLLGSKIPQVIFHILQSLRGQYAVLSQSKYGSNVVEKCLSVSTEEQSSQIIMEILRNRSYPTASMLLVDQYGNFVIQSALMVAKGGVYKELVGLVQRNLQMMRNNMFGEKVLSWLRRRRRIPLL